MYRKPWGKRYSRIGADDDDRGDTRMDASYTLTKNILGGVMDRIVEVQFPVYLLYSSNYYPDGQTFTYAAYYSFASNALLSEVNPTRYLDQNPVNDEDWFNPGYTTEFRPLCYSWGLHRVKSVDITFVRDYTLFPTEVQNLPTLSACVQNSNTNPTILRNLVNNYTIDNNCYYQVVNTQKNVSTRSYDMPLRTVLARNPDGDVGTSNDWVPTAWIDSGVATPFGIWLKIGQSVPAIASTSSGNARRIGSIFIKLSFQFAQPVTIDPASV